MLSRFSSLFTYVIVGLVVSAAATPLNPLGGVGGAFGDRTKSLSRPHAMNSNDMGKPYGGDRDKSYDDKDKHYDNDRSERHGQCSVEKQHCCNQVNEASEASKLESLGSSFLGLTDVVEVIGLIRQSNQLWGFDCSPALGGLNAACNNQQVCCEGNHQNGLIVVGCNNVNII